MENTNDLVVLGRTGGAYGVRGWVRVFPTETGEVLLAAKNWFLIRPTGEVMPVRVKACRPHGTGFIAQWEGCESKEAADALRGQVAVKREDFPDAGEDAVWAVDLVGCEVVNREGVTLGQIEGIGTNGVQDIFSIGWERPDGKRASFLIPNVPEVYILEIDVDAKRVTVDWDPEWR